MKKHIKITAEKARNCDDPMEMIDPLWWSVSIYDSYEKYISDLKPFTMPQRYVFAMMWYAAEVENGGHDQFFSNSTGIVWEDALNGFKEIGCENCRDILSEAAKRMGGKPSFVRAERWQQEDELEPDFEDLDDRFYDESNNYAESIIEYHYPQLKSRVNV